MSGYGKHDYVQQDEGSRFWRTLAGVLIVQVVALGFLWFLQMFYGL